MASFILPDSVVPEDQRTLTSNVDSNTKALLQNVCSDFENIEIQIPNENKFIQSKTSVLPSGTSVISNGDHGQNISYFAASEIVHESPPVLIDRTAAVQATMESQFPTSSSLINVIPNFNLSAAAAQPNEVNDCMGNASFAELADAEIVQTGDNSVSIVITNPRVIEVLTSKGIEVHEVSNQDIVALRSENQMVVEESLVADNTFIAPIEDSFPTENTFQEAVYFQDVPTPKKSKMNTVTSTIIEQKPSYSVYKAKSEKESGKIIKARRITSKLKMQWKKELEASGFIVCPGCSQKYKKVSNFETHYKYCSGGEKDLKRCPYCSSVIISSHKSVLHHMEVEHPEKLTEFKANYPQPELEEECEEFAPLKYAKKRQVFSKENRISKPNRRILKYQMRSVSEAVSDSPKTPCVRFGQIVSKINSVNAEEERASYQRIRKERKPRLILTGNIVEEQKYFEDEEDVDGQFRIKKSCNEKRIEKVNTKSRLVLNMDRYKRYSQYLKVTRDWASERKTYSRSKADISADSKDFGAVPSGGFEDAHQLDSSADLGESVPDLGESVDLGEGAALSETTLREGLSEAQWLRPEEDRVAPVEEPESTRVPCYLRDAPKRKRELRKSPIITFGRLHSDSQASEETAVLDFDSLVANRRRHPPDVAQRTIHHRFAKTTDQNTGTETVTVPETDPEKLQKSGQSKAERKLMAGHSREKYKRKLTALSNLRKSMLRAKSLHHSRTLVYRAMLLSLRSNSRLSGVKRKASPVEVLHPEGEEALQIPSQTGPEISLESETLDTGSGVVSAKDSVGEHASDGAHHSVASESGGHAEEPPSPPAHSAEQQLNSNEPDVSADEHTTGEATHNGTDAGRNENPTTIPVKRSRGRPKKSLNSSLPPAQQTVSVELSVVRTPPPLDASTRKSERVKKRKRGVDDTPPPLIKRESLSNPVSSGQKKRGRPRKYPPKDAEVVQVHSESPAKEASSRKGSRKGMPRKCVMYDEINSQSDPQEQCSSDWSNVCEHCHHVEDNLSLPLKKRKKNSVCVCPKHNQQPNAEAPHSVAIGEKSVQDVEKLDSAANQEGTRKEPSEIFAKRKRENVPSSKTLMKKQTEGSQGSPWSTTRDSYTGNINRSASTLEKEYLRKEVQIPYLLSTLDYISPDKLFKCDDQRNFTALLPKPRMFKELSERDLEALAFLQAEICLKIEFENCHPIDKKDNWINLSCFDGTVHGPSKELFTGGPVSCAAFCPMPSHELRSRNQYVALASSEEPWDRKTFFDTGDGRGSLQLWNLGKGLQEKPSMELGICHRHGVVTAMRWCPSGCYQDPNECAPGDLPRLGLLGVACSDGCVRIYSLPHPSSVSRRGGRPLFRSRPSAVLSPLSGEPSGVTKRSVCTSLDWQRSDACRKIAAGYGNGLVCVWLLETNATILTKSREEDQFTALPHLIFHAHGSPVTSVSFPFLSESRWLATSGYDRSIKFFDLLDTSMPFCTARRGLGQNSQWALQYCGAYGAIHDGLNFKGSSFFKECGTEEFTCQNGSPGFCMLSASSFSQVVNAHVTADAMGTVSLNLTHTPHDDPCQMKYTAFTLFETEVVSLDGSHRRTPARASAADKSSSEKTSPSSPRMGLDDLLEVLMQKTCEKQSSAHAHEIHKPESVCVDSTSNSRRDDLERAESSHPGGEACGEVTDREPLSAVACHNAVPSESELGVASSPSDAEVEGAESTESRDTVSDAVTMDGSSQEVTVVITHPAIVETESTESRLMTSDSNNAIHQEVTASVTHPAIMVAETTEYHRMASDSVANDACGIVLLEEGTQTVTHPVIVEAESTDNHLMASVAMNSFSQDARPAIVGSTESCRMEEGVSAEDDGCVFESSDFSDESSCSDDSFFSECSYKMNPFSSDESRLSFDAVTEDDDLCGTVKDVPERSFAKSTDRLFASLEESSTAVLKEAFSNKNGESVAVEDSSSAEPSSVNAEPYRGVAADVTATSSPSDQPTEHTALESSDASEPAHAARRVSTNGILFKDRHQVDTNASHETNEFLAERSALSTVTTLTWNPNSSHHAWVLVAGHSGVARLISLSDLVERSPSLSPER